MIKFDEDKKYYVVTVSARHPKTKVPHGLKRIGFSTKAEAERAEKSMRKQLYENFMEEVHPCWMVVSRECVEHLTALKGDSCYLDDLDGILRLHTFKAWGRRRIDEITPYEIEQLVKNIPGVSEERKKDILKHIRQVFDFALFKGYIKTVPYPKMKFKKKEKHFKTLNEHQAKIFLQKAWDLNHPWKEIWSTATLTGMRNGELFVLKPEDIDFDMDTIHVCRGYDRKKGVVDYTKTGHDRVVDLAPPLKRIFKKLIADDPSREFLLPRIAEWETFQQAAILRKFLKEIGLPSIRFHDLRAAWCTILLSMGVPSEKVRAMGGWRDLKTFQRYIRQSGIQIKGALKILDKLDWE